MSTKRFVTYGFGTSLENCYSEVEVPNGVDPRSFIFSVTQGKHAFSYSEEEWVYQGAPQDQLYRLRKVDLQPQQRKIISPTIEIIP